MSSEYRHERNAADPGPFPAAKGSTVGEALRPSVEVTTFDGGCRVTLRGAWNLHGIQDHLNRLRAELASWSRESACQWDLRRIGSLDSIGALLIWQAWNGALPEHAAIRDEHLGLLQQWGAQAPIPAPPRASVLPSLLAGIGNRALTGLDHVPQALETLGHVVLDTLYALAHPKRVPWGEISSTIYEAGTRALAVTSLVGGLIGVVVSYLSATELQQYGAQTYIVDILGLGIVRELGPMLVAILVAGRSGSSMTAQLGIMHVTQELDALAAMGVSRTLRLVLPKILALVIVLPLLTLWADGIALAGGMAAARFQLGIGYQQFLGSLPGAVPLADLWIGLGKSAVFGGVIALTATHFGLRVKPNTRSIGVETTNSVVTSITLVIIVDAVFALLFQNVGLS